MSCQYPVKPPSPRTAQITPSSLTRPVNNSSPQIHSLRIHHSSRIGPAPQSLPGVHSDRWSASIRSLFHNIRLNIHRTQDTSSGILLYRILLLGPLLVIYKSTSSSNVHIFKWDSYGLQDREQACRLTYFLRNPNPRSPFCACRAPSCSYTCLVLQLYQCAHILLYLFITSTVSPFFYIDLLNRE